MRPAHHIFYCRTVAGIQEKIIEKGGRSLLSRFAHAKNDKETIATWKLDLNRILHVFNVGFVIPVQPLLTVHPQAELSMNTHVVVSEVHHGVVTTQSMVSDIHRNILKDQEGTDDQRRSVSDVSTPFHYRTLNKHSPLPRLKPGWRPRLSMNPMSYI